MLLAWTLFLLPVFIPASLWAIGSPYLVKNINLYYNAIDSAAKQSFAVLGNNLIFSANDGTTGQELWKSDGTEAGTQLIVNIRPGISWSSPENLTTVNNKVFFTADDGVTGKELWITDGTSSGTQLLADISTGTPSSTPQKFTPIGNTLYFVAANASGSKLWKSDGTPAGTILASEFTPGLFSSIDSLTAAGGKLLVVTFLSGSTTTWTLWSVDPVAGTTELVTTFLSQPKNLTPCNGKIFFSLNASGYGDELWQTDGTDSGTQLVKDISSGSVGSNPGLLTCIGSTLYFTANDPAYGSELWKSDGTPAGTDMVKDIYSGTTGSSIDYPTELNGTLVFRANSPETGSELWQSDGTAAGTMLVADITPGPGNTSPVPRYAASGNLFFNATGLWLTDGTTSGTARLSDITNANNFSRIGNKIYFSAYRSDVGNELWAVSLDLEPYTRILSPQSGSATNMPTINISGDAVVAGETSIVLTEVSLDGGTTWATATGTTSWNYSWSPATDGIYTVMARSTDSSSVTQAIPAASSITVDRVSPTASLQINNNASLTTYRTVTLSLSASATEANLDCTGQTICGSPQVRFSNDSTNWSYWGAANASTQWDLDAVNGVKTVYAQVRDRAGNTTAVSTTITLDTSQIPSSTIASPADDFATNSSSVVVSGTAEPGPGGGTVTLVEVSFDGGTTWQPATGTTTWSVNRYLSAEGSYTIKSRAWNSALAEIPQSGRTLTIDRTSPSGTLTFYYGEWTLNASDGGICVLMYPFICGDLDMSFNGLTWQSATTHPGNGGLWLRDSAGNASYISGSYASYTGGPVQMSRATPIYYSLLQHAYDAAQSGDLIKLSNGLTEELTLARSINLAIRGGYVSGFGAASGTTLITGGLTVQSGSATIENLDLNGTMTIIGGDVTVSSLSVQ